MLLESPNHHLTSANNQKDEGGPVLGNKKESDPAEGFKVVVGHGDQVEAVASGDLALLGTVRTEGRQVKMNPKVGELSKQPESGQQVELESTEGDNVAAKENLAESRLVFGNVRSRSIDKVGKEESREVPVMSTVLDNVEGRHSSQGELVDKDGLEFALQKVEHDKHERQLLDAGVVKGLAVDGFLQEVEDGVDENGPEVLDNVDSSPAELGTKVLDGDFQRHRIARVLGNRLVDRQHGVLLLGSSGRVGHRQTETVDGETDLLCDLVGQLLHRLVLSQFHQFWELSDLFALGLEFNGHHGLSSLSLSLSVSVNLEQMNGHWAVVLTWGSENIWVWA